MREYKRRYLWYILLFTFIIIISMVKNYTNASAAGYTLTLNGNGGKTSDSSSTKSVTNATTVELTNYKTTFTRDGYYFYGWSITKLGDNPDADKITYSMNTFNSKTGTTKITLSKNTTLYACWNTEYSITLNANGGLRDGVSSPNTCIHKRPYGEYYGPATCGAEFTRSGYGLVGWSTSSSTKINDTPTYTDADSFKVYKNITLYAVWGINYTVTLNPNGGQNGSTGGEMKYYSTYGSFDLSTYASNFHNTGYILKGWSTSSNGAVTYSPKESITVTKDTTLYAIWISVYKVTYDLGGGKFTNGYDYEYTNSSNGYIYQTNPLSNTVTYNGTNGYNSYFRVENPTRDGYTFEGWKITGLDSSTHYYWYNSAQSTTNTTITTGTDTIPKSVTLFKNLRSSYGTVEFTAHWTAKTYTLTINPNGGKYNSTTGTTDKTVTYGKTANSAIGTASWTGYTFDGFYTSATGGTQVYDSDGHCKKGSYWSADYSTTESLCGTWQGTSSLTVYAHWTTNEYTLDLNGYINGKTTSNIKGYGTAEVYINGTSVASSATDFYKTYPSGTTYKIVITPATGYYYVGIYDENTKELTNKSSSTISGTLGPDSINADDGDTNIFVCIKPYEYTVTYNANKGTGTMSSQTARYGESFTTKANEFTRTGYTWAGWNEKADGSGTSWTDWVGVKWTWTYTKDVILYAQWTGNTYTIEYDANGGTGTMEPTTHTYGIQSGTSKNKFTRTGYEFIGWYPTKQSSVGYFSFSKNYKLSSAFSSTVTKYGGVYYWKIPASNGVKEENSYIDIYNNGKMTTAEGGYDSVDTRVYIWSEDTGTVSGGYGVVYHGSSTYDATENKATGVFHIGGYAVAGKSINNCTVIIHTEYHFYKAGTLNSSDPVEITDQIGTVALTDFDKNEGWLIEKSSNYSVVLDANTSIKKADNSDWYYGTKAEEDDSETGKMNVYFSTTKDNPLTLAYDPNISCGSTINASNNILERMYTLPEGTTHKCANCTGEAGTNHWFVEGEQPEGAELALYKDGSTVMYHVAKAGGTAVWYAQWSPILTVTYYGNGSDDDTITDNTDYADTSGKVTIRSNFYTKTGYSFTGWSTTADGSVSKYTVNKEFTITSSIELYAKWTPITYTIVYDLHSGKSGTSAPDSAKYNETFTVSAPTKTGYAFTGWSISTKGKDTFTSTDTTFKNLRETSGDVTFKATWTANKYYLNLNGIIDGVELSNLGSCGVATVYVNGVRTSNINTNDHYQQYTYGSTYEIKDVVALEGYEFVASESSSLTGTIGAEDITVWLCFKTKTYTVTYNGNNETSGSVESQTKTYNVNLTLRSNTDGFVRTGYTFKEWNTQSDGKGTSYAANATYKNNAELTLYAIWSANTYTVAYELDGGTLSKYDYTCTGTKTGTVSQANPKSNSVKFDGVNSSSTSSKNYTDTYFHVETPKKTGYKFYGWTISGTDDCTHYYYYNSKDNQFPADNVATGTSVVPATVTYFKNLRSTSGTVTFTAKWTAITYKIEYKPGFNDGSNIEEMAATTHTYGVGKATSKNTYERTGYTFAGWTSYRASDNKWLYKNTSNGNLAFYEKDQYPQDESTYEIAILGNGREVYYQCEVEGDIATWTAQWTPITYNIKYNLNDSTGSTKASAGASQPTSATFDETFSVDYPTRDGYTFSGWKITDMDSCTHTYGTTSNNEKEFTSTASEFKNLTSEVNGTVTFTAQWEANAYTIVFNGNGNTGGSTKTVNTKYDEVATLTANGFTKTNYTFEGWSASAQSVNTNLSYVSSYTGNIKSSTALSNKASVKNLTKTAGETINLYAVWYANSSLNIDPNGGSLTVTQNSTAKTIKVATDFGGKYKGTLSISNFTRTGYDFSGWEKSSSFSGTITSSSPYTYTYGTTAGAKDTLKAKWTPHTYSIQYNGGGAKEGSTATSKHTYDTAKTLTANGFVHYWKVTYDYNYVQEGTDTYDVSVPLTFAGWKLTGDTSGTLYTDEASVSNLTSSNNVTLTMTAQWTNNPTTLIKAEKAGYTFLGWYDKAAVAGSTLIGQTGDEYTPTKDVTLYAHWIASTYDISYTMNNIYADITNPATYTTEASTLLSNPVAAGYEFAGWKEEIVTLDWATAGVASNGTLTINNNYNVSEYIYLRNNAIYTIKDASDGYTVYIYNTNYVLTGTSTSATISPSSNCYIRIAYNKLLTDAQKQAVKLNVAYKSETIGKEQLKDYIYLKKDVKYTWSDATLSVLSINKDGSAKTKSSPYTPSATEVGKFSSTSATVTATGTDIPMLTMDIPVNSTQDRHFTATWELINYNITYNLIESGVTHSDITTYNVETGEHTFNVPTKTGYVFLGWTVTNDGVSVQSTPVVKYTMTAKTTGNLILTANWKAAQYTITFHDSMPTGTTQVVTYTYGKTGNLLGSSAFTSTCTVSFVTNSDTIQTPDSVSVKNTISKWSDGTKDYALSASVYNWITKDTQDGTNFDLYAVWNMQTITMPYVYRTGYEFKGWYTDNIYSEPKNGVAAFTSVTATDNTTYYAKWEKVSSYSVTFNNSKSTTIGVSGTVSADTTYSNITNTNTISSYSVDTKTTSIIAPSKAGYTFKRWNETILPKNWSSAKLSSNNFSSSSSTYVSEPLTVVKGRTYTFNGNSGDMVYVYSSDGSTYKSYSAGVSFTPSEGGYVIIYSSDGKKDESISTTAYGEENAKTLTIAMGSSGNRVYAPVFTVNTYTVDFVFNFGDDNESIVSNTMVSQKNVPYESTVTSEVTLNKCTYSVIGYKLSGWSSSKTGTVLYKDGGKIDIKNDFPGVADTNNATITLYAIWEPAEYTVSFDTYGLVTAPSSIKVLYKKAYNNKSALPTTAPNGYTLATWTLRDGYYDSTTGKYIETPLIENSYGSSYEQERYALTKVDNSTIVTIPANHTLHAIYVEGTIKNYGDDSANNIWWWYSETSGGEKVLTFVGYNVNDDGICKLSSTSSFSSYLSKVSKVVVDGLITGIDAKLFEGNTTLESVTIKTINNPSIGASAFSGCSSLTTVTVPSGMALSSIGASAFKDCSSLTTYVNGITIGDYAYYSTGITKANISTKVESIGAQVFSKSKLTEVNVASNANLEIDDTAFINADYIEKFTGNETSGSYYSSNDILYKRSYTYDGKTYTNALFQYPAAKTESNQLTTSLVTPYAFDSSHLSTISLKASIATNAITNLKASGNVTLEITSSSGNTIDTNAVNSTKVNKLYFNDTSESSNLTIKTGAFTNTSITNVTIPSADYTINLSAFPNNTKVLFLGTVKSLSGTISGGTIYCLGAGVDSSATNAAGLTRAYNYAVSNKISYVLIDKAYYYGDATDKPADTTKRTNDLYTYDTNNINLYSYLYDDNISSVLANNFDAVKDTTSISWNSSKTLNGTYTGNSYHLRLTPNNISSGEEYDFNYSLSIVTNKTTRAVTSNTIKVNVAENKLQSVDVIYLGETDNNGKLIKISMGEMISDDMVVLKLTFEKYYIYVWARPIIVNGNTMYALSSFKTYNATESSSALFTGYFATEKVNGKSVETTNWVASNSGSNLKYWTSPAFSASSTGDVGDIGESTAEGYFVNFENYGYSGEEIALMNKITDITLFLGTTDDMTPVTGENRVKVTDSSRSRLYAIINTSSGSASAYKELKINTNVTVSDFSVELTEDAASKSYSKGDTISVSDLIFTVRYSNGYTLTYTGNSISNGFVVTGSNDIKIKFNNDTSLSGSNITLSNSGLYNLKFTLTRNYNNKNTSVTAQTITASCAIPVQAAAVKSISATYSGGAVPVNTNFTTENVVMTIKYANGDTKRLTPNAANTTYTYVDTGEETTIVQKEGQNKYRLTYTILNGDINEDGVRDTKDETLFNELLSGTIDTNSYTASQITSMQFIADMNGDGKLDDTDKEMFDKADAATEEYTCEFIVSGAQPELTELKIVHLPITTYTKGDDLNITDLVVEATYSNGTSQILTYGNDKTEGSGLYLITDASKNKSSFKNLTKKTTVYVYYKYNDTEKMVGFDVTIAGKVLDKIEVTKNPNQLTYSAGDKLELGGMVVTAYYYDSDGTVSSEVISKMEVGTNGYTVDTTNVTLGQTKFNVSYTDGGVTASASVGITVSKGTPVALTILTQPAKTDYIAGETFNPLGMIVQIRYSSGITEIVEDYTYTTSALKLSSGVTSEAQKVAIKKGDLTANVDINVFDNNIVGIDAIYKDGSESAPGTVTYKVGTSIDKSKVLVYIYYQDGTTKTAYLNKLAGAEIEPQLKISRIGQNYFTVSYGRNASGNPFTATFSLVGIGAAAPGQDSVSNQYAATSSGQWHEDFKIVKHDNLTLDYYYNTQGNKVVYQRMNDKSINSVDIFYRATYSTGEKSSWNANGGKVSTVVKEDYENALTITGLDITTEAGIVTATMNNNALTMTINEPSEYNIYYRVTYSDGTVSGWKSNGVSTDKDGEASKVPIIGVEIKLYEKAK